jgi:cyclase
MKETMGMVASVSDTDVAQTSAECAGAMSRRRAIGLAMGAGIGTAALASVGRTQPAPAPVAVTPGLATDIRTELKLVAPNVFAYIQREAPGMSNLSISNCGVIVGPKSLTAIDATSAPVHAKKFRAEAERTTGKRFSRMVITHHHGDHILGLQFFDGVDVIAQEECRVLMEQQSLSRPGTWDRNNRAWTDGPEEFRLVLPTITYSERMTLHDSGPTQQLICPGRAHTLGDTMVFLPKEKVIFLGDIGFFDVTPLNGSGFIGNWIKVCDDILRMDVQTIVPGHGPVGGKAELEEMKQYLVLLYNGGKKSYDRGVSPGRAAAELDLGKYAKWVDSDRVVANMTRLYTEFAGSIGPGNDPAAVRSARTEFEAIRNARK